MALAPWYCDTMPYPIRYRISVDRLVNTVPYRDHDREFARQLMADVGGLAAEASGRDMWIEAALKEIGRSGVEGVRVELLAESLGITKGGFYRRFRDRRALLDALLETWQRGRIAAIEKQTALGNADARDRLRSLIRLYSERLNPAGIAIELAIRQWARSDAAAVSAVTRVDAARLSNVAQLYRALGLATEDAQARAILLYSFIFGQSLLFLGEAPRKRASLIAACADVLTDVTTSRRPGSRARAP
jgi:AcrR family transcriptional regulator